ncbi:nitrous oxide-stimulated promoter family protein [Shewanella algae]|uniref:nitrous oxide-stimulated promoter family protein n=1 Tax=Shewanella algae TaxID=38313 RepID=UPI001AAF5944|nr:nitrous oxide-stimulated promoter family protein [Shewanella algae]EKT4487358.1 nitrous oxide-stimulated promoter family protein [Shewanella algae]MBO2546516.1 nitrous oxide-stimulated promoter family protein [Shewanella algae]
MELLQGKLLTEFRTVSAMVWIYCRDHHPRTEDGNLCPDCQALMEYAHTRLDRCPYGESKPTCNKCPVHCYKPEPKEQMRQVMRYAGPRMLLSHPILALRHLWCERKAAPGKPPKDASNRHKRMQCAKN